MKKEKSIQLRYYLSGISSKYKGTTKLYSKECVPVKMTALSKMELKIAEEAEHNNEDIIYR